MDKKVTGIVSYLTWIGWIVAFVAGDKQGAKFHLNQSLVLMLASLVTGVLAWIPVVDKVVWILNIALFVLWVLGFIAAIKDEEKEIPLLGSIKLLK